MRRFRLKTAMIAIALLALILGVGLGLRRRSESLQRRALVFGREANRLENLLEGPGLAAGRVDAILDRVHWNDSVANAYRSAAGRPWVPIDPDPARIACGCGVHRGSKRPAPGPPQPAG